MNNIWSFINVEKTEGVAAITVTNPEDDGTCIASILERIAKSAINIDMISQLPTQNKTASFSFSLDEDQLRAALDAMGALTESYPKLLTSVSTGMVKLRYHHVMMQDMPGAAAQIFKHFASRNIEIVMVTTSLTSVQVLVRKAEYDR